MSPEVIYCSELQTPGSSSSKARSVAAGPGGFGSQVKANQMAKPTKEQIIHRAYELWEQNNKLKAGT
jgi:hypothetical protein